MKQRLALARALLNHPPLLFLDEPTSGLDPEAAQQVHELIAGIRSRNGHTVLLCTHNLFDAERLCDRVAILNHGRLLALGSLEELRRQMTPGIWVEVDFLEAPDAAGAVSLGQSGIAMNVDAARPSAWKIQVRAREDIPTLVDALVGLKARILQLRLQQFTLEDIYFKLQAENEPSPAQPDARASAHASAQEVL
jgi:ABC-2 type transport system ATP-binding protein